MAARVMKAEGGPKGHFGARPKLGNIGVRRVDDKPSVQKKGRVDNPNATTNNPINLYGHNGFKGRLG